MPRAAHAGSPAAKDAPAGRVATNDRPAGRDTLSVTDNRTGKTYELPIDNGTVRAAALRDIKTGPDDFGLMAYDPAFTNTAHCQSKITMIDGDKGILNYRGYPIEQLAEHSTYLEVAYLIVNGELPARRQYEEWVYNITHHTFLHENMKRLIEAFRYDAHPMGILVSTVGALSTFYSEAKEIFDPEARRQQVVRLIAKMPTLAAFAYRASVGMPFVYPDNDLSYTGNFLNRSAPSTCCSSCTPTTSRTARRWPCAPSARRTPTPTRRSPPPSRLCTARCTAAPTRWSCGC
ncbi:MAG: hypothetical protein AUH92_01335 [Acidobacteria bacterium 13_1_40CM_4_69_4]|nr:MAG: hypothetical protein AUH92_01335 [Acidobacteria bacterium 13_1_40CM_4_69_4]